MSRARRRARRRRPGGARRRSTATCSGSRSTRSSPRTGTSSCSGPTPTSSSCSSSPTTSPMTAPRLDHFGLSVATLADFEEVARRAAAWKAREPDEVDLIEPTVEEYAGVLRLHSFYVRYRLPLMVETQHFEYPVLSVVPSAPSAGRALGGSRVGSARTLRPAARPRPGRARRCGRCGPSGARRSSTPQAGDAPGDEGRPEGGALGHGGHVDRQARCSRPAPASSASTWVPPPVATMRRGARPAARARSRWWRTTKPAAS